jgi:Zn-dependent membrane protease YugP
MTTRPPTMTELRASYTAFAGGMVLAGAGIWKGADLNALGVLIGAVTLPLMWYTGARTAKKIGKGKDVE